MKREGAQARPVVALVARLAIDAPPEQLESVARVDLTNAASVIGWVAGEVPEPFAVVTATLREVYFRIAPPQARRRFRLGFGNTGADYYAQIYRIVKLADEDERFAFVLSLYKDALREANAEFRVARFFACLEALAYRLKKDRGSRDAVRALLGLEPGALATIAVDGVNYRFDRVELGGRIRDKLFHGVPFDPKELTDEARFAYNYFRGHPEYFRDLLHVDCELEIARWANDASRGQISDGVAAV